MSNFFQKTKCFLNIHQYKEDFRISSPFTFVHIVMLECNCGVFKSKNIKWTEDEITQHFKDRNTTREKEQKLEQELRNLAWEEYKKTGNINKLMF